VDALSAALDPEYPAKLRTAVARRVIDRARASVKEGADAPGHDDLLADARSEIARIKGSMLTRVINATGVLVHTNLGRAPLGDEQIRAVAEAASGYSNLEFDLNTGKRGSRNDHVRELLVMATGAEDAIAVNNNAAAILLALVTHCRGREVIISRGELIEIGGEFRIPAFLAESGARLIEVGTTNRTHLADYERAIGPDTAAILKVHPSNYKVVGFSKSVALRDLAKLARGRGVHLLCDLGSGLFSDSAPGMDLQDEPVVELALEDGADLVTFSGDKLMGGPQAGVVAGRSDLVAAMAIHPLARALRIDKMSLAALQSTLQAIVEGRAGDALPLWQALDEDAEVLRARAEKLAARLTDPLGDVKVEVRAMTSVVGGGSLPGLEIPSWGLALAAGATGPDDLQASLRASSPPIVGRIESDALLIDLRTVRDHELETLERGLAETLGRQPR
jgi:L-seryl-tRNA(Ser) seleniumtransferase